MSDDQTTETPPTPPTPPISEPAAERTRWRDRALGFRGVLAVAAASLILGGLGGTAIGVVASGDDDHDHGRGPARMDFREGDRQPHGVPGMPGTRVPPVAPPQDDVQPDGSGETDSGTNS